MSETTEETTIPTNEELMEALTDVKDPEPDMSIVELGLVYDLAYDDGEVIVSMTLTSQPSPRLRHRPAAVTQPALLSWIERLQPPCAARVCHVPTTHSTVHHLPWAPAAHGSSCAAFFA